MARPSRSGRREVGLRLAGCAERLINPRSWARMGVSPGVLLLDLRDSLWWPADPRLVSAYAERADNDWRLTGLVLGRSGISARLVGTGPDALIDGEVIGWEAVSRLGVGLIIVRDTPVLRGNFASHGKAASVTPWRR